MPYIGAKPDKGNFSDLNGGKLIIDADADTSLTADTDDQIDIEVAGADVLQIKASSGDAVIKAATNAKDILFQQYDGRTLLDINDGGYVAIANGATGAGQLRLYEDTDNGTNYSALQVGTQSADITYTLPTADGSSGQMLSTNGSGTLSWATAASADPSSADGDSLGTASAEWSDLYLADGGVIYFGNDQDVTVTHDPDDGLFLKSAATSDDNPFLLTLQTGETDLAANDVIGKIAFQAPDEGTGTDAILVSAAIQARAEGDHSSSSNATTIDFMTGASEAATTKMTLASDGKLEVGGELAIKAASGVLETNANFVDCAIFGPAVDGVPWKGLWTSSGLFSSLMLVTVEDEGSNTEVNIWDLTEQSAGSISTTPIATVDLSNAATPTAVDAAMGYIIVGCEDGIHIIDPHDGTWAERTKGWPKTLSTSTVPAISENDVQNVAAGVTYGAAYDQRTGGQMPSFTLAYSSDASDSDDVLKWDGQAYTLTTSASNNLASAIVFGGYALTNYNTDQLRGAYIDTMSADEGVNPPYMIASNEYGTNMANITCADEKHGLMAMGGTVGLGFVRDITGGITVPDRQALNCSITRVYNTGWVPAFSGSAGGSCWLANSNTADRLPYGGRTLTQNGTITEAAVASGAELKGYSGYSSSINQTHASHANWDVTATGSFYMSIWFKTAGNSAGEIFCGFSNSGNSVQVYIQLLASGILDCQINGATATGEVNTTGITWDDGVWHKADLVNVSSTERYLYVDGVLFDSNTTDSGSVSDDGNLPYAIGCQGDGSTAPATSSTLALHKWSKFAPTANQINKMYIDEYPLFQANAECLLQSGTTDAVLDVSVDPLGSGKTLVTQTDAITVFDGLVVDSKPTVNSGASEHGKLWGDLRVEINSANAYVTAPAHDQNQINEASRSMFALDTPSLDLSRAKAWLSYDQGDNQIQASYNIKSVSDDSTGNFTVKFAIPFKEPQGTHADEGSRYVVAGMSGRNGDGHLNYGGQSVEGDEMSFTHILNAGGTGANTATDNFVGIVWFGELSNE